MTAKRSPQVLKENMSAQRVLDAETDCTWSRQSHFLPKQLICGNLQINRKLVRNKQVTPLCACALTVHRELLAFPCTCARARSDLPHRRPCALPLQRAWFTLPYNITLLLHLSIFPSDFLCLLRYKKIFLYQLMVFAQL